MEQTTAGLVMDMPRVYPASQNQLEETAIKKMDIKIDGINSYFIFCGMKMCFYFALIKKQEYIQVMKSNMMP